jgi:Carboxypeptidase regulatory-like domain
MFQREVSSMKKRGGVSISWLGRCVLFVCFCMLSVSSVATSAQTASSGLVTGQVTDPSGAAVPGATVTLVAAKTSVSLTATTDSDGRYVFSSVEPGDYTVRVSRAGFQTAVVGGLHVEVLKSITANAKLTIGQPSETIEVTAAAGAELQTTTATVGTVVNTTALENLPQYSRSSTALMYLQPGVVPDAGDGNVNRGGAISGSRTEQVTYLVDGGDATSDLEGSNSYVSPPGEGSTAAVVPIPIETTEEFRVATSSSNATFDRTSGGQVGVVTKRGTNAYHGEAYEYHNDTDLNANLWQNNRATPRVPRLHAVDNRFGGNGGGPVPFLKDRAWFFGAYEGHRFNDSTNLTRLVPSATLRQGILRFKDPSGNVVSYSLAPGSVSSNCGPTGISVCDPRTNGSGIPIGMSPAIASEFALFPQGNNTSLGDTLNTTGYTFNVSTPIREDIAVTRLDFKLNSKWNLFGTWHWARAEQVGSEQVNIVSPTPVSVSGDPFWPSLYTVQVTGQLTPNLISVTHGSYLRHDWAWARTFPTPFTSGVQQVLQLAGEGLGNNNGTAKLLTDPINVNTQQARGRIWDGHDWFIAEDMNWVRGAHIFQFGGSGYIYHDYHLRTDDVFGGLTNGAIDFIEANGNGNGQFVSVGPAFEPQSCTTTVLANCLPSNQLTRYNQLYATVLGLVDRSAQIETRNGTFQPNPLGTPLFDNTTIPAFYLYFQDVIRLKPSFTLTAGLAWGAQLPPSEQNGKQVVLVNAATGDPVNNAAYLAERTKSLSQGVSLVNGTLNAFNPQFALTPVASLPPPLKGQFKFTDWHDFSPRISGAWNVPFENFFFGHKHDTVIRAGYSIMFDRTTAVNQVLSPLLTGGLADVDACGGPISNGSGGATCTGSATDPTNAFRIGVDGNNVPVPPAVAQPIPFAPGNNFALFLSGPFDPYAVPGHAHNVSFSIQRALPGKMLLEVGYIGKFSRNLPQGIALNAPYYLTKDAVSGQTYAQAFDCVALELRHLAGPSSLNCNTPAGTTTATSGVSVQPFFENMMGVSNCTAAKGGPFASCTALVAKNGKTDLINGDLGSFAVDAFDIIKEQNGTVHVVGLDNTQIFEYTGITGEGGIGGFSNYNAGYISLEKAASRGLQFAFNYTWSHAVGNQGLQQQNVYSSNSPYNLSLDYSSELFDRKHVINTWWTYALPFGKGGTYSLHNSVLDRTVGGWTVSGIFTLATGFPLCITANGDYGALGGLSGGTCAIPAQGFQLGNLGGSRHTGVLGSNGIGTSASGVNLFSDPNAVYQAVSRPLLSQNGQIPFDQLRTPIEWNVDLSIAKNIAVTERYKVILTANFLNAFNHDNFRFPSSLSLNSPASFGVYTAQVNAPRRIQIGARFEF